MCVVAVSDSFALVEKSISGGKLSASTLKKIEVAKINVYSVAIILIWTDFEIKNTPVVHRKFALVGYIVSLPLSLQHLIKKFTAAKRECLSFCCVG